jgi:hypothetical protein
MAEMSGDSGNIEFGPCQVTFNSVDLGFFMGGVTFAYNVEYLDLEADQSSMPLEPRITKETAVVTVPMTETDLATLSNVMPTGTYVLDAGAVKKKLSVGGGQVGSADLAELVLTPISDGCGTLTTDNNELLTVHKAFAKIQFEKAYDRENQRVVPVEFHAYRDSTKSCGEQLFLLGDSTATA